MTKKLKGIGIVFLIILMISMISIGCQNEDGIDDNEDTGVNDDGDQDQDIIDEDLTDESKDNADENMTDEGMDNTDEDLSNSIVEINGINDATVVTMDEVALVGVDSNGEDEVSDEMKQNIESKIKEQNKNINEVYVSNEPDMFDRINEISNNVRKGDPIDDFTDDISEMIDNITPDNNK